MTQGLRVSNDGKPIKQGSFKYDTNKGHLQVDLVTKPKHADLLDTPKITAFANGAVAQYETLLTVPHKLPFTPRCSVFFFLYDANAAALIAPGQYIGDLMFLSGGGLYQDMLYYKVDDTNFYIKHYFDDSGAWLTATGRTSLSDQMKVRIKYLIHDNPGRNPRWVFDP